MRGGARLLFIEAEERGNAPTMPGAGAVAACGLAGRFRGARGEDGADKRARAVSVWARGRGRLPGAACWAGAAAGLSSWGARLGRRLAGRAGKRERRVSGPRGKKAMWADNKEGGDDHFHFLFSKQIFPKAFSNNFLFHLNSNSKTIST